MLLKAGLFAIVAAAAPQVASAQATVDCSIGSNAGRPECQGRGVDGLQQRGVPSGVTPAERTGTAPGTTGSVTPGAATTNPSLVDCSIGSNAGRPECQGRGTDTLQQRGVPSGVTPGARSAPN
jgi:hypothetical protein